MQEENSSSIVIDKNNTKIILDTNNSINGTKAKEKQNKNIIKNNIIPINNHIFKEVGVKNTPSRKQENYASKVQKGQKMTDDSNASQEQIFKNEQRTSKNKF